MRKAYLFLIALFIWSALFWWHYVFNIKQLGNSTPKPVAKAVATDAIPVTSSEPKNIQLLFKPSTYGLIVNKGLTELVDSIVNSGQDDQLLQITGFNSPSEQINLDYELGLARAAELKKLLINKIPEDRIEIHTDTSSFLTYTQDSLVEAVFYEWVEGYTPLEENLDYYLVNHPNKRIKTEDFEELFGKLATRLIETGEKVIIKGHTDSAGDSELNFTIALRNAKDVRDILQANGVPTSQIETTSRGEDEPIGDNATEIGQQDNRRIELDIRS